MHGSDVDLYLELKEDLDGPEGDLDGWMDTVQLLKRIWMDRFTLSS